MRTRVGLIGFVVCIWTLASGSPTLASPPAAGKPSIRIVSPANGATIQGSTVTVKVAVSNFKLVKPVLLPPSKWSTIPLLPGNQGHIHYVLDSLSNLLLTRDVVVQTSHTWTNVAPGKHTIIAYLATSQHAQFPNTRVATVHITVVPAAKPSPARKTVFTPSIQITTVKTKLRPSGMSIVVHVAVSHFTLVKPILRPPSAWSMIPLLPGNQGHIHYVLDSMANFRLTRDVVPDLVHHWTNVSAGWHTITAYLATSQHQAFPGAQPSSVRIYVPNSQRVLRIRSLPGTGGASTVHHAPPLIGLLAGFMITIAALGILASAAVRPGSTRCAKR